MTEREGLITAAEFEPYTDLVQVYLPDTKLAPAGLLINGDDIPYRTEADKYLIPPHISRSVFEHVIDLGREAEKINDMDELFKELYRHYELGKFESVQRSR